MPILWPIRITHEELWELTGVDKIRDNYMKEMEIHKVDLAHIEEVVNIFVKKGKSWNMTY